MIHAVIGIGSNSSRLLIADVEKGTYTPLLRMRESVKLFAGMCDGKLSGKSMDACLEAVNMFVAAAREEQSNTIRLIATSACRDAVNSWFLKERIKIQTGLTMEIISGEEEARLSFLGCAGQEDSGMVDIGGGSTEIALGGKEIPFQAASAQLGAARLAAQYPDPAEHMETLIMHARAVMMMQWQKFKIKTIPPKWYAIGGTCTCLASMEQQLKFYDRERVDGFDLTRNAVTKWAGILCKMTQEERSEIRGIQPKRADIIAHGAVILQAVMETGKIEKITVSNRSNLDGCMCELAKKMEMRICE